MSKRSIDVVAPNIHDDYHDWMKVNAKARAAHRDRLLAAGGRLFRARGVAGVSVAEVSIAAGLTHGAFYGHFDSKAALAEAACRAAARDAICRWRERADWARSMGQDPAEAIVSRYLSMTHCEDAAAGCALAALGGDAGRPGSAAIAPALGDLAGALVEILATELQPVRPGWTPERCAQAARGALCAMHGGLVLARSLLHRSDGRERAQKMLNDARSAALQALGYNVDQNDYPTKAA